MTREDFDQHNQELWEGMKRRQDPQILAAQLAYAELLNRKIFGNYILKYSGDLK